MSSTGNASLAAFPYKCSDVGLLLPFLDESQWSIKVRGVLYFLGLLYSFFGVSIAADVFMSAIERITSTKRRVKVKDGGDGGEMELQPGDSELRYVEVLVWNPTVANLTLMALGSSAPEILLSCIEIIGRGMKAGELGPSTIVGSAAFNLLVITAVCIVSIPSSESRRIDQMSVFVVTALFSLFAYIWLIIILKVSSPDVVEVWEAALTLVFFLLLVVVAYIADKQFCCRAFPIRSRLGKKPKPTAISPAPPQTANGIHVATDEYNLKEHMEIPAEEAEGGEDGAAEAEEEPSGEQPKHPNAVKHASPLKSSRPTTAVRSRTATSRPKTAPDPRDAPVSPTLSHGLNYLNIERESSFGMDILHGETAEGESLDVRSRLLFATAVKKVAGGNPDASAETIARLAAKKIYSQQPHSRMYYRIHATRLLTGGDGEMSEETPSRLPAHVGRPNSAASTATLMRRSAVPGSRLSVIEFAAKRYAVSEADGHVRLKLIRHGRPGKRILFKYETMDGTAQAGKDYKAQSETLVFNPQEMEKYITISLVHDSEKEPEEVFYVKLGLEDAPDGSTLIGQTSVASVTISDSDKETKIQFPQPALVVKENAGVLNVPVVRRGNTHNSVAVIWKTVNGTAQDGEDFYGGSGQLFFDSGEIEKWIDITIVDDKDFEKHENFEIQLVDVGNADAAAINPKKRRCVVTILNDDETTLLLTQSDKLVARELAKLEPGGRSWAEQIRAAVNVNGGNLKNATRTDYVIHVLSFGWKLLFSFVPPPHILGGWLTFFIALALIGVLTAVVGDLAGIFGCLVNLQASVTAITFVALGTSLPDLFASKLAATHEATADNSVGNVTGSNSVNVFLGLGISWLIGAAVSESRGEVFVVPAGSLSFSVLIYTFTSMAALGLLFARRTLPLFGSAELGGPKGPKYACATFLVVLWLLYVLLSSLEAYGHISAF